MGYIVNTLNREDFLPSESPPKKYALDFFTFFIIVQVVLPLTLIKISLFKELSIRHIEKVKATGFKLDLNYKD